MWEPLGRPSTKPPVSFDVGEDPFDDRRTLLEDLFTLFCVHVLPVGRDLLPMRTYIGTAPMPILRALCAYGTVGAYRDVTVNTNFLPAALPLVVEL